MSCAADYTHCPKPGLPPSFCCPPGQECIVLAGNTTIICCPDDSGCVKIRPLTCNLSLQNATENPDALLKTLALTGDLPTCGAGCCPWGFWCNVKDECVQDKDQSKTPAGFSEEPKYSSTRGPTSSPTTLSSATSTSRGTTSLDGTATSNTSFPTVTSVAPTSGQGLGRSAKIGIAVGVSVGFLAFVLTTVAIYVWNKRRYKKRDAGGVAKEQPPTVESASASEHPATPGTPELAGTPAVDNNGTPSTVAVDAMPSQAPNTSEVAYRPYRPFHSRQHVIAELP